MSICLRELKTVHDAYEMLDIRNSCRDFMTENGAEISTAEQTFWFANTVRPSRNKSPRDFYAFLVSDTFGTIIGYAIARVRDDGKWWVTAGLLPEFRGRGFGRDTFRSLNNLVRYYDKEVWLDVLISNVVAHDLYTKLGYREMDRTDRVITMRKEL